MSGRSKLFVGLAVGVAVLVLVFLLRRDGEREREREQPKRATTERAHASVPPRAHAPTPGPERAASAPEQTTAPELRDETGQLLADGPAQATRLPERPEGALDNVPTADESVAAIDQVLTRLEAEIADARAAGDTATVERLEVRRARLERKQSETDMVEAAPN